MFFRERDFSHRQIKGTLTNEVIVFVPWLVANCSLVYAFFRRGCSSDHKKVVAYICYVCEFPHMQLLGMNFLGNISSASLIYCRLKAQALISGDASQNYPKIVVYHLLFLPMLSKNIQLAHTPPLSSPSQASSLRSSGVTAQGQPVCSVPVAWKM
jgi:hypothetical protein